MSWKEETGAGNSTKDLFLLYTYFWESPLVLELVLSGPLLRHKVLIPREDLLEFSNVQDGHDLHVVAEDQTAQILHVVSPAGVGVSISAALEIQSMSGSTRSVSWRRESLVAHPPGPHMYAQKEETWSDERRRDKDTYLQYPPCPSSAVYPQASSTSPSLVSFCICTGHLGSWEFGSSVLYSTLFLYIKIRKFYGTDEPKMHASHHKYCIKCLLYW